MNEGEGVKAGRIMKDLKLGMRKCCGKSTQSLGTADLEGNLALSLRLAETLESTA